MHGHFFFQSEDGEADEDSDDGEHADEAREERINMLEQFKSLPGDLIEIKLTKDQGKLHWNLSFHEEIKT